MYDPGDQLLFALSAWRKTSWTTYKKVFDQTQRILADTHGLPGQQSAKHERFRTARLFSSLGHIEHQVDDDQRIHVAPAVLAALPLPGLPKAVLCGARSPNTIRTMRDQCRAISGRVRVSATSQASNGSVYAPSRVIVEAESPSHIARLASQLGIACNLKPVAWTLAEYSSSLGEYLASLDWMEDPELDWERRDFDAERMAFGPPTNFVPATQLSKYMDPTRPRSLYRLAIDGQTAHDISPDWGRFAVLRWAGRSALLYDEKRCIAAVPRTVPLPPILARTLGLCSGYAPATAPPEIVPSARCNGLGFDVYTNIPHDVILRVGKKLDQTVTKRQFDL